MSRVASIDVHKRLLAVVIYDAASNSVEQRRIFSATEGAFQALEQWLRQFSVTDVVMESTAQYWKPVWRHLEDFFQLHLAQAQSNRAPRGRKTDFGDAERLARRFVAGELILSFVPNPEQRLWRTLTHSRVQLIRDRVRLVSQLEGLLEDSRIKLSSFVSDLLGVSSRRMMEALANGAADPAQLAALADPNLRASSEQLRDALGACVYLDLPRRQVLRLMLDRLALIEQQLERLEWMIGQAMQAHQPAVTRLVEIPGIATITAHQIVAEVGPQAATFPTAGHLASWTGLCPGREESAGESASNRSPKGNRSLRRILNQAANAAIKATGSIFQLQYRRLVSRLGHNKAVWAVAHKLCRLVWITLHNQVHYQELGDRPDPRKAKRRINRLLAEFRRLGFHATLTPAS